VPTSTLTTAGIVTWSLLSRRSAQGDPSFDRALQDGTNEVPLEDEEHDE
jgi:hypothetical protein